MRFGVRRKSLGRWGDEFCWERLGEMREVSCKPYIKTFTARWIERYWELSRIKISQKELLSNCQEASTAKWPWRIKQLSRIYQAYRNFLDGSRIYREAIELDSQKSRWIKIAITTIEKGSSRGSIDSLAVKRCPAAIKIA